MDEAQVNLLAVLIAAAAYFGLGGLWYSPKLFGNAYLKEAGVKELKHDKSVLIGEAVLGLIIAAILALLMSISNSVTALGGFKIGLLAWLGFVAPTKLSGVLWGKLSLKMFYINGGFLLAAYLIMGILIGLIS